MTSYYADLYACLKMLHCVTGLHLALLLALSSPKLASSSEHHSHHKDLGSEYSFKLTLRDDELGTYILHWKFDVDAETIGFAVNVSTRGWVGFGLSPNGGMPGSDVVIGWVDEAGQTYFNVS